MSYARGAFDAMFADSDDPWQFKSRWYESRKRALTLACLPAARYASGYEPGCANGELSAALAERCDRLLISDGAARAVDIARQRTGGMPNVEVRHSWVPDQWPEESFDLVVVSELAYYFDAPSLEAFSARVLSSLRGGGTVLACHWRRPIEGCVLGGDEVQARLGAQLGLAQIIEVVDDDLRLNVWSRNASSVGQREGLVAPSSSRSSHE